MGYEIMTDLLQVIQVTTHPAMTSSGHVLPP